MTRVGRPWTLLLLLVGPGPISLMHSARSNNRHPKATQYCIKYTVGDDERSLHKMFSYTSVPTNSFYISSFPWTVQLKCVPIRKSNKHFYINLRNTFFPILVISSLDALNCIIWVFPWRVYTTTPFMGTVGGLSSGTYLRVKN